MKVLIAQTNTTPRDFIGNCNQIKMAINHAKDAKALLVVTPELSIPGYGVKDLMYQNNFVERNLTALKDICTYQFENYPDSYVVVGYVDYNNSGVGKPFRNMVAILCNGNIIATYAKQILPFYDVFDEARYYEPGKELTVVEIEGVKWGICICEDLFNDKGQDDYNYRNNPLSRYRDIGIDHIISVNGSPFTIGKPQKRDEIFKKSFQKGTLIYVNQIGGQDDLVFDGCSLIIEDGLVIHRSDLALESTYETINIPRDISTQPSVSNWNEYPKKHLFQMLVLSLRDYCRKNNFKTIVFGSSGGIDSALVACLSCEAIGPENVYGIRMPSIYSSAGSRLDAEQLHENLGCHDLEVPISHMEIVGNYKKSFLSQNPELSEQKYNEVADENIQARIRGTLVMYYSNSWGALPLTTGNKSEISVGYSTLYGDQAGGFAPISDLWKTQVYELAKYYNGLSLKNKIPQSIIGKAPSAELKPDQKDEDSLLPYPVLDVILKDYVENHIGTFDDFLRMSIDHSLPLLEWLKNIEYAQKTYEHTIHLVDRSEYKRRQSAPGTKVSKVAFGTGRRMPITKK